jgi:ABC-type Mn2+/Zn2+ transport system ATPase subunit
MPFTVADVVVMGRYGKLGLYHWPGKEDWRRVSEALESVGISTLGRESYKELSGGQKQRVLIARALVTEPDVLVLDEPTNGMDLTSRTSILALIQSLRTSKNLTVVMVSHLLTDVASFATRIAIVEEGLFQVGPTEEILTASNLSQVYRMQVDVRRVSGTTIILPRAGDD